MHHLFSRFKVRLTKTQIALWTGSVVCVAGSAIFGTSDPLSLAAALIGVTSLIFTAVGNILGPLLMIVFSILYGIISYDMAYYGEMITYLGMTAPMSAVTLAVWLRHPSATNASQVEVAKLGKLDVVIVCSTTVVVTAAFWFVLDALGTASLTVSTISVATSYAAAYLTWRRSPTYALAYAANDVVLLVLWGQAMQQDISYVSVVTCFAVFLANDLYGYVSWRKMQRQQARA